MRIFGFFALATTAHAAEIVVAGDSWGQEGRFAFASMFEKRGFNVTILNVAKGGSKASDWAQWGLKQHLADDTRHVWLSISGNDAQRHLPGCGLPCVPALVNNTKRNIKTFVLPALAAYPRAQLVGFGYDLMNFGYGLNYECFAKGLALLPQCAGAHHVRCINEHFSGSIQRDIFEALAAETERFVAVDIRGALQAAGGLANASAGHPDLSLWSPAELMQKNCIHPDWGEGWITIMDALWETYFSKYYYARTRPGGQEPAPHTASERVARVSRVRAAPRRVPGGPLRGA